MAGRKKKPCEWCEQEQIIQTEYGAPNVSGQLEVYPDNCLMAVCIQGLSDDGAMTHEETFDIPMYYCPNCGRKLGW